MLAMVKVATARNRHVRLQLTNLQFLMRLSEWKFTGIVRQFALLSVALFHSAVCHHVAVTFIFGKVHLLDLMTHKGHPKLLIDILKKLV